MTDWTKLAEPFDESEIKQRPGRGGMTFSYVDARAVMQRLDDVLTPEGWDFTSAVIPGSDVVHGKLVIGVNIREDYGYPNTDNDDEPIKSASSDALKRCAVMFGIGRHLYDDNKSHRTPSRAPVGQSRTGSSSGPAAPPARPAAPSNAPEFAPNDWDEPTPIRKTGDGLTCPEHGVEWRGDPGDLFHKTDDGKWCRHPDNVQKKAGSRR